MSYRNLLCLTAATGALLIAACSSPPVHRLGAVTGFRAELENSVARTPSQAGEQLLTWRTSWRLFWTPVPDAVEYAVSYRTSEGGANQTSRKVDVAELTVEAAAGTSPEARMPADRAAALAITGASLAVAIAPVARGGVPGQISPWFPVGETVPGDPG